MTEAVFAYLAGAIIVLSILVVTMRNPVHSVLFMLFMFFHIAGLYIILNAEFLAAIQVIVYAGAIMVLFLFVILLLNLKEEIRLQQRIGQWSLGLLAALALLLMTFLSLRSLPLGPLGTVTTEVMKKETNTKVLGKILFTEYLFPFEVVSLVLLVAMVGAIVLAKKKLRG